MAACNWFGAGQRRGKYSLGVFGAVDSDPLLQVLSLSWVVRPLGVGNLRSTRGHVVLRSQIGRQRVAQHDAAGRARRSGLGCAQVVQDVETFVSVCSIWPPGHGPLLNLPLPPSFT